MHEQLFPSAHVVSSPTTKHPSRLSERADEVLIATAVVGLVASVADGEPDPREIECVFNRLKHRFALSDRAARRLVSAAVYRIRTDDSAKAFENACDTLRAHLDIPQRLNLMDDLADIVVSDDKIHELEEYFLDHVAVRLSLVSVL